MDLATLYGPLEKTLEVTGVFSCADSHAGPLSFRGAVPEPDTAIIPPMK